MSIRWSLAAVLATLVVLMILVAPGETMDDLENFFQDITRNPFQFPDYRDHSCKRPCKKGAAPMSCHYYFLLEHFMTMPDSCQDCPRNVSHCFLPQCVPGDGRSRGILTANRMLPGPTIDVCEGDTVVVLIDNRMELGAGTTIHWHGLRQVGIPHMDGALMVTQCPINALTKMAYRFKAADPGTHFWHSHASSQRSDGLFGGLIVRTPNELDPHRHLYDYDLPEHYIILSDWGEKGSGEEFAKVFHAGFVAVPVSVLINGMGSSKEGADLPYSVFTVKPGRQYRFRMAYNGIVNCPIRVSVDDHTLLVIAADGRNIEPVMVNAFMILSGERYDFILTAKHEAKDNFWMRFKGHGRCLDNIFQVAIVRYEGASETLPKEEATYNNTEERASDVILGDLDGISTPTNIQVFDLKSFDPEVDEDLLRKKPDKQFYISLAASKFEDERFKPPLPDTTTGQPLPVRPIYHQLNYISSHLPPSPPLTQLHEIPQENFCDNTTVVADCSQTFCSCTHLLKVDFGDIVEIVLVSFTNTLVHPMHLHGHTFRVVGKRNFPHDITVKDIKALDKKGLIPRKKSRAAYKDTVPVPSQSVIIIRLRANNPGFWFFHCHIELHAELGMALILQSGKPSEIPKPPRGFPACGNWRPAAEKIVNALENRQAAATENTYVHAKTFSVAFGSTGAVIIVVIIVFVVVHRKRTGKRNVSYQLVS